MPIILSVAQHLQHPSALAYSFFCFFMLAFLGKEDTEIYAFVARGSALAVKRRSDGLEKTND